jgi:hypothetical protein
MNGKPTWVLKNVVDKSVMIIIIHMPPNKKNKLTAARLDFLQDQSHELL